MSIKFITICRIICRYHQHQLAAIDDAGKWADLNSTSLCLTTDPARPPMLTRQSHPDVADTADMATCSRDVAASIIGVALG